MTVVYVYLSEENTSVWAPMDAEHVRGDIYRIVNDRGEEDGQFHADELVKCRLRLLEGDTRRLVAYELAAN